MCKRVAPSRAFSLVETLTAAAIVIVAGVVLIPIAARAKSSDYGRAMITEGRLDMANALYLVDYDPQAFGFGDVKAVHATRYGGGQTIEGNSAMIYHNGPIMLGTVRMYYIWYGNWSGNSAVSILTDLANNIGGTPYYNINTTYWSNPGQVAASNSVVFGGSYTPGGSYKTRLRDSDIRNIVSNAISGGFLPKDTNGVYFVLTSQDVTANSGFCTQYCGWHTHATIGGSDIKYSFVGNAARCLSACAAQSTSPNGNAGADAMASVIAHELEEAHTDPDLNAWYTSTGYENADMCAWTFGTTSTAPNGSQYNVTWGSRNYLIQQNYINATTSGSNCAMKYP